MTQSSAITAPQQQAQMYWRRARALHESGQIVEAAQAYGSLLQLNPGNWSAMYNLGLIHQELGWLEAARDSYRQVIKLNPSLAQGHNNLGNVYESLNQSDDALGEYERAIALNPALAQAHYNSGLILQAKGRLTDATVALANAVELDPANDDAWEKLFSILFGLKRKRDAFDVFVRWEQATPPSFRRLTAGLIVSRLTGDAGREARYLSLLREWPFPGYSPPEMELLLGNLQYFDVPPDVILACYERFNYAMNAQRKEPIAMLPRRSPGKIRIGYVSPDFRQHVMGRIMLDILRKHDKSRFEIYLVSTCNPHFHDETTQKFREAADGFADIFELLDLNAAQVIAEADLDVLVDLAGHTTGSRAGVYAHRPARHMVTHLGYHGCLGLNAVEYKFTDRYADNDESTRYQIEKPFYLDCCVMPFSHDGDIGDAPVSRDEMRRAIGVENKFVFATFVNPMKLSPRCLATWAKILSRVPSAVLAFSPYDKGDYPQILEQLAAAGIDGNQVVHIEIGRSGAEQRSRYIAVDAVLDTFPYAGGDTTLAALDMNVPVVTLVGARHAERIGFSILNHLGVTDTIAFSEAEFVDIATRMTVDAAWCGVLREQISSAKNTSNLTRISEHTRALERAFVAIADVESLPIGSRAASEFYRDFKAALRKHKESRTDTDRDEAALAYDRLLAEQPGFGPALFARGMLAQDAGQLQAAADYLALAVDAMPADAAARVALAALRLNLGVATGVIELLAPLLEPGSRNARAHQLAAQAGLLNEDWQGAAVAAERAVKLEPTNIESMFSLGVAHAQLSRTAEALTSFNCVLALDRKHIGAIYAAALLQTDIGDMNAAESLFRQALAIDERHESAHWRLGALLLAHGRLDEFVIHTKGFAKACTSSLRARFREVQSLHYQGKLEQETNRLRDLFIDLVESNVDATIEELLKLASDWAMNLDFPDDLIKPILQRSREVTDGMSRQPPAESIPQASRKYRIGYLACECRDSDAGRMLLELVQRHDRTQFECMVYSLDATNDELTPGIEQSSNTFTKMPGWSADSVAMAMRAQNLDLLVDLTSIDNEKSATIVAKKPAAKCLLYPLLAVHGCKAATFRLNSLDAELPLAAEFLPATPALMSGAIFPWSSIPIADSRVIHRSQLAIPDEAIVFGVFAPPERLSARCISLWKSLLDRVPAAVILVAPPLAGQAAACERMLVAGGIARSRLKLIARGAAHVQPRDCYALVDAVVDSVPTNDAFSLLRAIGRGVPVVTLQGQLPGERMGGAILSSLGVEDTVASGGRQYVDLAAKLAEDRSWRLDVIRRIKGQLPGSRLADMTAFMREYEAVLARLCKDSNCKAVAT